MNWGEMKAVLRLDLNDDSDDPRWTDEILHQFWVDAVRDYSRWFPYTVDKSTLSGTGVGPYTLPSDYLNPIFVEVPEHRYLEERQPRPGVRFPTTSGRPFNYYLQGGSLYLDNEPLDSESVLLTYEAMHSLPTGPTDDADDITIPDEDLELPRLYVQAKVYGQMRSRQSSLDRFKTRVSAGSTRQDNPLEVEVESLMDEYHLKISERIPGGSVKLSRPGRMK